MRLSMKGWTEPCDHIALCALNKSDVFLWTRLNCILYPAFLLHSHSSEFHSYCFNRSSTAIYQVSPAEITHYVTSILRIQSVCNGNQLKTECGVVVHSNSPRLSQTNIQQNELKKPNISAPPLLQTVLLEHFTDQHPDPTKPQETFTFVWSSETI